MSDDGATNEFLIRNQAGRLIYSVFGPADGALRDQLGQLQDRIAKALNISFAAGRAAQRQEDLKVVQAIKCSPIDWTSLIQPGTRTFADACNLIAREIMPERIRKEGGK